MNAVLKINNVSKSFHKRKVIDNISFEVYEGEVFGFLGPNGAGKTTTIKMIMGFLSVDSGSIDICGYNLNDDYEKAMAQLGGIVENPELYRDLSGRKNLEMYARLHDGVTKERIEEVINLVGMANRIDDKVKRYSLGMKQRIGLAEAILHKPKILILDEPTNGLDPAGIKALRMILTDIAHKENTAVIVSSHQLAEMELMCDRVGVISAGRFIGEQPIGEFLKSAAGEERYIFDIPEDSDIQFLRDLLGDSFVEFKGGKLTVAATKESVPDAVKLLCGENIAITGLNRDNISLEEAFIDYTEGANRVE